MPQLEEVLPAILGKKITGIVAKVSKKSTSPSSQVILVFSDNTSLELYTTYGQITSASGLDRGGMQAARQYLDDAMQITLDAYLNEYGKVVRRV